MLTPAAFVAILEKHFFPKWLQVGTLKKEREIISEKSRRVFLAQKKETPPILTGKDTGITGLASISFFHMSKNKEISKHGEADGTAYQL